METFIKCIKASGETVGLLRWCSFTLQLLKLSPAVNGVIFPNKRFLFPFRTSCGLYKSCVWFVGGSSVGGFSAIKMTALAGPQFLVGRRTVLWYENRENGVPVLVFRFLVSVVWNFYWTLLKHLLCYLLPISFFDRLQVERLSQGSAFSQISKEAYSKWSWYMLYSEISDLTDAGCISLAFTAGVLRRACEMATVFCLPCRTAANRWHTSLRAETGAQTDAGEGIHFHINFSDYICTVKDLSPKSIVASLCIITQHQPELDLDVLPTQGIPGKTRRKRRFLWLV